MRAEGTMPDHDVEKTLQAVAAAADPVADLAHQIRKATRRSSLTLEELSSRFDRGVSTIERALEWLHDNHYNIRIKAGQIATPEDIAPGGEVHIDPKLYKGREFRFGVVSDNHLGSKYERLDVLNALYDKFLARGISTVFNAGNILDGRARFNQFDLLPGCESMEGQLSYFTNNYPQRKGIETQFIAGDDHEGWWAQREGVNIGKLMESRARDAGRTDLKYIGYLEADVLLEAEKGETWIRVMHPGGGSAYALSYAPQKTIESLQGGEKPAICIFGHWHKCDFCYIRNVYCISAMCTQDQTPFMRKKKLEAHVGGWSCKLVQAPDAHVSSLELECHPFYDRGFYHAGKEKYPRW
jgi:hypothetical protein